VQPNVLRRSQQPFHDLSFVDTASTLGIVFQGNLSFVEAASTLGNMCTTLQLRGQRRMSPESVMPLLYQQQVSCQLHRLCEKLLPTSREGDFLTWTPKLLNDPRALATWTSAGFAGIRFPSLLNLFLSKAPDRCAQLPLVSCVPETALETSLVMHALKGCACGKVVHV
jgi:hypothetical protein